MPEMKHLAVLIDILRKRDVNINRANLQAALQGECSTAITSWINEHLGPETLLTRDELDLLKELELSGQAEALASSPNTAHLRVLGDQEMQCAIERLHQSTVVIEKHTELLCIQQDAMSNLVKANKQYSEARANTEDGQHRVWITEAMHTNSAIDELTRDLTLRITEIEETSKAAETNLRKTASDVLRADDKFLVNLQTLATGKFPGQIEEDDVVQRVRDLCARLIKYTVEGVRTHLDRVYLEAISSEGDSMYLQANEDAVEVTALQEELESLYAEILSVAQMSAEQQYLEKATRITTMRSAQERERLYRAITFISKSLSVVVHRLQELTTRVESYQSYRATTQQVNSFVKAEIELNLPLSPTALKPSSLARVQKLNKQTSTLRPRNTRRRSSLISLEDDSNTEQQLLRNLGISLPAEVSADNATAENLKNVLLDRTIKLQGHAKNLQESSETSIACHVHNAQMTFNILRQSLLSETEFTSRRLLDLEIPEALAKAESEIEGVKLETGKVDLERLRERNIRKEELVQRWR